MLEPFLICFREALQSSVIILAIASFFLDHAPSRRCLFAGFLAGMIVGTAAGYFPFFSLRLPGIESWTFWRYVSETFIFYSAVVFSVVRARPSPSQLPFFSAALGLLVIFFSSRAAGFLIRDIGLMQARPGSVLAAALAGAAAGFLPLLVPKRYLAKVHAKDILTLPILLMSVGALQFFFGGVGELEKGNVLIDLQRGLQGFIGSAVRYIQSVLLISGHPFIPVPFSGLADFLAGDRTAMTVVVFFISIPPLVILVHLFARPDPVVDDIQVGAQRRLSIAFFRKELASQTIPVLTALLLLILLLHQANISVNPLYEPVPVPVREAVGEDLIRIPLADRMGDFSDGKVKKYVYYYGNKEVLFFAIQKADGSMGVALDECEICRPADWNKDARGYAQRGANLVCKYCMTPIAIPTVNNPGGCNPIPLPFRVDDGSIVIALEELIRIYKNTQALEKKGTHF